MHSNTKQKTVLSIEASPASFDRAFDKLQGSMQPALNDAFQFKRVQDNLNTKCNEGYHAINNARQEDTQVNTHALTLSSCDSTFQGKEDFKIHGNRRPLVPMRSVSSQQSASADKLVLISTEKHEISRIPTLERIMDQAEISTLNIDGVINSNSSRQLEAGETWFLQNLEPRSIGYRKMHETGSVEAEYKEDLNKGCIKDISDSLLLEVASSVSINSIDECKISILKKNKMQEIKRSSSPCQENRSDLSIVNEFKIMNNFCRKVKFKAPEQSQVSQEEQKIVKKVQDLKCFKDSQFDQYDSDVSMDICELYNSPNKKEMTCSIESSLSDLWRSSISDFDYYT
jgi:hypothetical protein